MLKAKHLHANHCCTADIVNRSPALAPLFPDAANRTEPLQMDLQPSYDRQQVRQCRNPPRWFALTVRLLAACTAAIQAACYRLRIVSLPSHAAACLLSLQTWPLLRDGQVAGLLTSTVSFASKEDALAGEPP